MDKVCNLSHFVSTPGPYFATGNIYPQGGEQGTKLEWVWIVNVKCLDNFSARPDLPSSEYHLGPRIRDTLAPKSILECGASVLRMGCRTGNGVKLSNS